MSYLVMARRWRPQMFSEVVGQEHVTRTLQRAISRGRVAHAYIFTGPRGVGKTTTARLLAKAVNCQHMKTDADGLPEPCNECPTCVDITSGNALDVIEIDGASNNRVEDVRQLRETVKFAPSSLNKKVYIIDEVHMLSTSAFNALLKTLEEPPDHAMFIFATTEIHKVPPTVLSRCQRFDFKRIPTKEIRTQLQRIVEGDKLEVDDDALVSIAVKAEGALRDALSVLDQLVAYQGDDPITGDVVRQALGLIGSEIYFRTTDVAGTGDVATALAVADAIAGGGHDPREYLRGLQNHVLRMLFLRAGGKPDELDVSEEDRQKYQEVKGRLEDEDLLRIGEWAAESEDVLRDALDPEVRLELLLVRIARMDRAVDLGALLERMGLAPASFRTPVKRPENGGAARKAAPAVSTPKGAPAAETAAPSSPAAESAPAPSKEAAPEPQAAVEPPKEAAPAEPAASVEHSAPEGVAKATAETEEAAAQAPSSTGPSNGAAYTASPGEEEVLPPPGEDEGPDDEDDDGGTEPPEPEKPVDAPAGNHPTPDEDEGDGEDEDSGETPPADDSGQLSLVDVRQAWLEICDQVNLERTTLGIHLEQGAPTAVENGAIEVTFDPMNKFDHDQVLSNRDLVTKVFRLHFGSPKRLMVKMGTIPEGARPPKRKTEGEERRERFGQLLNENPVWKELVRRLELKLLDD